MPTTKALSIRASGLIATNRYKKVIQTLLDQGKAYHCYCIKEELEALRAQQMARKEKPRYTGICRSRTEPREGVEPVVRFRSPDEGEVVTDDVVRGRVVFQNKQLDDLIIMRSDGTPTYNLTVDTHPAEVRRPLYVWKTRQMISESG